MPDKAVVVIFIDQVSDSQTGELVKLTLTLTVGFPIQ
jgi:hypothetical protein